MSVCRAVTTWAEVAGWDVTKNLSGVITNTNFRGREKDDLEKRAVQTDI